MSDLPDFDFTFEPLRVELVRCTGCNGVGSYGGDSGCDQCRAEGDIERRTVAPESKWEELDNWCRCETVHPDSGNPAKLLIKAEPLLDKRDGPIYQRNKYLHESGRNGDIPIDSEDPQSSVLNRLLKTIEGSKAEIWICVGDYIKRLIEIQPVAMFIEKGRGLFIAKDIQVNR